MSEHSCPECGSPMALVNLLPETAAFSQRASFYCRACDFADTVPISFETIVTNDAETAGRLPRHPTDVGTPS